MPQEIKTRSIKRADTKGRSSRALILFIAALAVLVASCSIPKIIKDPASKLRGEKPLPEKPHEDEPLSEHIAEYLSASPCCESFKEFRYERLYLSKSRNININSTSKAFNFKEGKSYFTALALPYYKKPYQIKIRSFLIEKEKSYIFYPTIIFLDEAFQVTRHIDRGLFKFQSDSTFRALGITPRLEGIIGMTRENAGEAFIIIMTDAGSLDTIEETAAETPDTKEEEEEIEEDASAIPETKKEDSDFELPVMKEIETDDDQPAEKETKSAPETPAIKKVVIKAEKAPDTDLTTPAWEKITIPRSPVGSLNITLDKGGELKE